MYKERYKKAAEALADTMDTLLGSLPQDRRTGHMLVDFIRSKWSEEKWRKLEKAAVENARETLPLILKADQLYCLHVSYGTHHPAIIYEPWLFWCSIDEMKRVMKRREENVASWEGMYMLVEKVERLAVEGDNLKPFFVWLRPDVVANNHSYLILAKDRKQALVEAQKASGVIDIEDLMYNASEDPKFRFHYRKHAAVTDFTNMSYWRDDATVLFSIPLDKAKKLEKLEQELLPLVEKAEDEWLSAKDSNEQEARKRYHNVRREVMSKLNRASKRYYKLYGYRIGLEVWNEYTLLEQSERNVYNDLHGVATNLEELKQKLMEVPPSGVEPEEAIFRALAHSELVRLQLADAFEDYDWENMTDWVFKHSNLASS